MAKKFPGKIRMTDSIPGELVRPVQQAAPKVKGAIGAVNTFIGAYNAAPGTPNIKPLPMGKGGVLKKGKPPKPPKGFKVVKRRGR